MRRRRSAARVALRSVPPGNCWYLSGRLVRSRTTSHRGSPTVAKGSGTLRYLPMPGACQMDGSPQQIEVEATVWTRRRQPVRKCPSPLKRTVPATGVSLIEPETWWQYRKWIRPLFAKMERGRRRGAFLNRSPSLFTQTGKAAELQGPKSLLISTDPCRNRRLKKSF
jgi:hypothetical protein